MKLKTLRTEQLHSLLTATMAIRSAGAGRARLEDRKAIVAELNRRMLRGI